MQQGDARQDTNMDRIQSKDQNNPTKLLTVIEDQLVKFQESKYKIRVIADAMCNFINLKQNQDENLIYYTAKFKSAMDALVAQIGGTIILKKSVMSMSGQDASDANKTKRQQDEEFDNCVAFIYFENLD